MVIDKDPGLSKVASWYRLLLFRRWERGSSDNWLAVSLVLSKCFETIFNLANIQLWGNFWFLIFERAASSQPCTLEMLWSNSKTWWTVQTKMRHRRWSALVRGRQSMVTYQRDLFLKLCHLRPDEERGAKEFPRRNWVLRPQQAWRGWQPRRQRGSRRRATQLIILWCANFRIVWWQTVMFLKKKTTCFQIMVQVDTTDKINYTWLRNKREMVSSELMMVRSWNWEP